MRRVSKASSDKPRGHQVDQELLLQYHENIQTLTHLSDSRTAQRLADWWDACKIELRKSLLATTKTARQGLTRSYRQRLQRFYVRLDASLLDTRSSANSLEFHKRYTTVRPQSILLWCLGKTLRNVDNYGREPRKSDFSSSICILQARLLVQHTYTPGETSRRYYARVATKFQDNTIISVCGQATYGPNRSQDLADEMADGWGLLMTHFFDRPDATAAFLERATPPISVDDSNVTSSILPDDVGAALKILKRGKAAGPDEINDYFYRDYADALAPILAALYTRWME